MYAVCMTQNKPFLSRDPCIQMIHSEYKENYMVMAVLRADTVLSRRAQDSIQMQILLV